MWPSSMVVKPNHPTPSNTQRNLSRNLGHACRSEGCGEFIVLSHRFRTDASENHGLCKTYDIADPRFRIDNQSDSGRALRCSGCTKRMPPETVTPSG
jgi:hypothetical protein